MKPKMMDLKTATITSKGQIAIPRDIRNIEGFNEGSKIVIIAYEDHVELKPLKQVSIDLEKPGILTALASEKSLAKDWNTVEEDEAWKNL